MFSLYSSEFFCKRICQRIYNYKLNFECRQSRVQLRPWAKQPFGRFRVVNTLTTTDENKYSYRISSSGILLCIIVLKVYKIIIDKKRRVPIIIRHRETKLECNPPDDNQKSLNKYLVNIVIVTKET